MRTGNSDVLLEVEDLRVAFSGERGPYNAVDGVGFALRRGETLCLVGESGCGKSVTALSLLSLLPQPPSRLLSGRAFFRPEPGGLTLDLLSLAGKDLSRVRGALVGMVFQDPMTALNPVLSVGDQIAEPLLLHAGLSRREARQSAVELMRAVGMPDHARRYDEFPHQMSGGMRQRVMIAQALACRPRLLIADEPTTALDASLQGQILRLMRNLVDSLSGSMLLITHDLDVVGRFSDQIAVMYAGRIVESGATPAVLREPRHPYTEGLIRSRPRLDPAGRRKRLQAIGGVVPQPWARPPGCAFSSRCPKVEPSCREAMPELLELEAGRYCRCPVVCGTYARKPPASGPSA